MRAMGMMLAAVAASFLLAGAAAAGASRVSVFASGLDNPRGLTFGPDGSLYVAEGGMGGSLATAGDATTSPQSETPPCRQVPGGPGGPGPDTGGYTSRITKIDKHGRRSVVVSGLPSSQTTLGPLVSGVADVKFLGGRLYAIEGGAGCSHGLAGTHNSLLRVDPGGHVRDVVDLSAYLFAHPVADTTYERDDFEPDGTWYSMVALGGVLYAVEPNHQEIDRITPQGRVSRVLDMSARSLAVGRWIGPTSLSTHDGALYFGALGAFPVQPGIDSIWKLTTSGHLSVVANGLTTVLGTAWDKRGRLYALESVTAANFPVPGVNPAGTGKVVRINADGSQTVVVDGLTTPTAITFGPDGALYISNNGFGAPPGAGQIWRVTLP